MIRAADLVDAKIAGRRAITSVPLAEDYRILPFNPLGGRFEKARPTATPLGITVMKRCGRLRGTIHPKPRKDLVSLLFPEPGFLAALFTGTRNPIVMTHA